MSTPVPTLDRATDIVEQITTAVRRSIPCDWQGYPPDPRNAKDCANPATWTAAPPCGHDWNNCDEHRRALIDFWLDAKLDNLHFLRHAADYGCGEICRPEQVIWTRL